MTPREATALCRLTKACCPQQAIDEWTPDAWHALLGDLRFEDAKEALIECAKREPFVAPSDIRAEVKRMRARRLDVDMPTTPPADLDPDDPQAYIRWLVHARKAIADGVIGAANVVELPKRDIEGAIEGTFRVVGDE